MASNSSQKRLNELVKQIPSHDAVLAMLGQLRSKRDHASDRAVAIVEAGLIEHDLKVVIQSSFVTLSANDTNSIFSGRGALASFGDRVLIAYAMGLIGPKAKRDLKRIQDIRNAFAHGAFDAHFNLEEISVFCEQFELVELHSKAKAKTKFIEAIAYISGAFQKEISKKITTLIPGGGFITMPNPNRRYLP